MTNDIGLPGPWVGPAYRHVPADADVLNFRHAGTYAKNRWNSPEYRTLYLAGDQGVLAAEWARRLPIPWSGGATRQALTREVFRLAIRLDFVHDLRSPTIVQQFGVTPSSNWIADTAVTRHVARQIREGTPAQAIIVPSIAFIDDHTRWNLVVFLDKVPEDTNAWIVSTESAGRLQWSES